VPTHSHAGALGFRPPEGVIIKKIPADKSIGSMMLTGELDAVIHYIRQTNLVDRSTADLHGHPTIKTLFPDPIAEGVRYFRKTNIFPINHTMVVRRTIAETHPFVPLCLLKAFHKANEAANRQRLEHVENHVLTGLVPESAMNSLARSLVVHGLNENQKTLEMAALYSHQQGLTNRLIGVEELFGS
jgi:4,5-dihydroxyphthalate decarboxylase